VIKQSKSNSREPTSRERKQPFAQKKFEACENFEETGQLLPPLRQNNSVQTKTTNKMRSLPKTNMENLNNQMKLQNTSQSINKDELMVQNQIKKASDD